MSGSILLFPMLYVINDILTEVYGFYASRKVIWAALCFNVFLTLVLYFIVQRPPAPEHSNQEAFARVFGLFCG